MPTDVDVVISVILSMKGHARILLKQKRWFVKLKAQNEQSMKIIFSFVVRPGYFRQFGSEGDDAYCMDEYEAEEYTE